MAMEKFCIFVGENCKAPLKVFVRTLYVLGVVQLIT